MTEVASMWQLRAAYLRWAVVTVPLILLLGFASSRIAPSGSANAWYTALAKPAILPPDWLFPVAWTTLYILLGLALAMVLNARGAPGRGVALAAFALQMVLNIMWAPLFFGAHRVSAALLVIVAMFVAALVTAVLFGRIRAAAGLVMVPYLVWLAFAGVLNWQIDRLNPEAEALVPSSASTQIQL